MGRSTSPFAVPHSVAGGLRQALDSWRALRRGQAKVPFADDLDLAAIERENDDVFVLGVFERPIRFRFDIVSLPHFAAAGHDLGDRFLDEIGEPAPLALARAQADATVELGEPTFYQRPEEAGVRGYVRLMLPFWGEGHIKLVLGVVARG